MSRLILSVAGTTGGPQRGVAPPRHSCGYDSSARLALQPASGTINRQIRRDTTPRERPSAFQWAGALVAFYGIAVLALHAGGDVTPAGLLLVLLAALSWGLGNLIVKRLGKVDVLALVVWGSLVAAPPLLLLSLLLEGPQRIAASVQHMTWISAAAVAYISYPTTIAGFALWSWLMRRYSAATVAPLTLLVPVVAMASSALVLGEQLPGWKLLAATLVLCGLCLNLFGPRIWLGLRSAKGVNG